MRMLFATLALQFVCASAHAVGDATRGETLYTSRCGGCHSLDENRIGPRHRGVMGRRAGSITDYDYSPALRAAKLVWSPALVERWLADPENLIPGQKMGFRIGDGKEREDIAAYLTQKSK